jgi:diguanylate cyclase (GGDEF)-like protein
MTQSLPRILLIDDEADILRALERALRGKYDVVSTSSPKEAIKLIEAESFHVIISDQKMPDMMGTELLAQAAKLQPLTTRVILTAFTETSAILEAVNRAEIYRFVTKPWENQNLFEVINHAVERAELLRKNQQLLSQLTALNKNLEVVVEKRTEELKIANQKLSELAMTDPLTKILNRRAFSVKITEEIDRSSRYKHPILLAMVDVDHFKMFNDMEGHVYGDEALRKIAQIFTSNLRKSDSLARYGGEEFIIMMPETKLAQGRDICERLRRAIEDARFQGQKEEAFLTVSIGIAAFPEDANNAEDLIKAADGSLYAAKKAGRNRVMHNPVVQDEESFFVTS